MAISATTDVAPIVRDDRGEMPVASCQQRRLTACGRTGLTLAVPSQQRFEHLDGREEVMPQGHQHVDIVEIAVAAKTVRQIISGIHLLPLELWSHFWPN